MHREYNLEKRSLLCCDNPEDKIDDEDEVIHYEESCHFPNQVLFCNSLGKRISRCRLYDIVFSPNEILLNLTSVLLDDFLESEY